MIDENHELQLLEGKSINKYLIEKLYKLILNHDYISFYFLKFSFKFTLPTNYISLTPTN